MSTPYCPLCGGSGSIRQGGMDHSGQVEWVERCPNGCPGPKQAPTTTLGFIGEMISFAIGIAFIAGLLFICSK